MLPGFLIGSLLAQVFEVTNMGGSFIVGIMVLIFCDFTFNFNGFQFMVWSWFHKDSISSNMPWKYCICWIMHAVVGCRVYCSSGLNKNPQELLYAYLIQGDSRCILYSLDGITPLRCWYFPWFNLNINYV